MTERYTLLYDRTKITQRIGLMASEITAKHDGGNPLFVALLRGAAPFASQLMFEISRQAPDFNPELDYMITSRYGDSETATSDAPQIITDISPATETKDRTVIIVDNVLDMGETARYVREHILDMGARYVELAVLVEKEGVDRSAPIAADYVGFKTPDQWLVGMGMDDPISNESYRWANGIWTIARDDQLPMAALVDA